MDLCMGEAESSLCGKFLENNEAHTTVPHLKFSIRNLLQLSDSNETEVEERKQGKYNKSACGDEPLILPKIVNIDD